jgi:hypothetical protein
MPAPRPAISPVDDPAVLGEEVRSALVRLLGSLDDAQLVAMLARWNCPRPLGRFVVEGGLLLEPVFKPEPELSLTSNEWADAWTAIPDVWRAVFTLRDTADPPESFFPFRATLYRVPPVRRRSTDSVIRSLRTPHRAHDPGEWILTRIESTCTSCFGQGVVEADRRPCDACERATGWGLTSSESFPIPAR